MIHLNTVKYLGLWRRSGLTGFQLALELAKNDRLSHLQAIAADTVEHYRGNLGYFSREQMEPVPCPSTLGSGVEGNLTAAAIYIQVPNYFRPVWTMTISCDNPFHTCTGTSDCESTIQKITSKLSRKGRRGHFPPKKLVQVLASPSTKLTLPSLNGRCIHLRRCAPLPPSACSSKNPLQTLVHSSSSLHVPTLTPMRRPCPH